MLSFLRFSVGELENVVRSVEAQPPMSFAELAQCVKSLFQKVHKSWHREGWLLCTLMAVLFPAKPMMEALCLCWNGMFLAASSICCLPGPPSLIFFSLCLMFCHSLTHLCNPYLQCLLFLQRIPYSTPQYPQFILIIMFLAAFSHKWVWTTLWKLSSPFPSLSVWEISGFFPEQLP